MVERLLTIFLSAFLSSVLLIASGCGGGGDNDDSDGEQGSVIDDEGDDASDGSDESQRTDIAAVFSPFEEPVDQHIASLEQCAGRDLAQEGELISMLISLHGETLEQLLNFGLA